MAEKTVSLEVKINELKQKLRKIRFDNALGQLDDTSKLKKLRREMAALLTEKKRKPKEDNT